MTCCCHVLETLNPVEDWIEEAVRGTERLGNIRANLRYEDSTVRAS